MIQLFIKIANSLAGKIIFAALLFGMVFALGIGGITATSRSTGSAIQVGNQKISLKQLDELFSAEREKLSRLMGGKYLSPKEAIQMGLLAKVVQEQAEKMIYNGVKAELGLTATNAAIRRHLENHPAFLDANGHFDRALFMAYLRQMNMSEQQMAEQLQEELAIQHLSRAFAGLGYAPKSMAESVFAYQNEKRDITALEINSDKVKLSKQPTDSELKDLYDVYAEEKFITPEYRTFRYLRLTPSDIINRIAVSDAEIDAVFEERKSQFSTPEKRQVSQIFFKTQADADKAFKGLTSKNFNETAKNEGQDNPDFGYVAEVELMDELAEAAFKAKKGDIIGPVKSMTGWNILWVKDIQPAQEMPVAEMRAKIKRQLAEDKAYGEMENTLRQLEDILGVGDNLAKAAAELKLPVQKIDSVDVSGLQKDGKTLSDNINNKELLQSLFTMNVGEATPIFEVQNGYVVAELDKITPVSTKSFESVRADLQALWEENHKQEQIAQITSDVLARLEKGNSLKAQATFSGMTAFQDTALTRTGSKKITPMMAQKIFAATDKIIQIPTDKGVMIVQINDIIQPTPDKKGLEETQKELKQAVGQELFQEVISGYADEMGVNVNTKAIDTAFSVYKTEN